MKFLIIISTNNPETNWNALRLANFSLKKGDLVKIFLISEGVEYAKKNSERYNIQEQLEKFLKFEKAQIFACGTCLKIRQQNDSKTCPISTLENLYQFINESDKIISF